MKIIESLHGSMVADAASMGLHWMYDQDQIATIANSGDVLFRQPDAAVYENKKGYFAHGARHSGQLSHYGVATQVVASVIADSAGDGDSRTVFNRKVASQATAATQSGFTASAHQAKFMSVFGPGGSFTGYADRPTKALIARLINDGDEAPAVSGMDDDQLPALCAIPALFAAGFAEETITQAVRVTTTNAIAIDGAHTLFRCLTMIENGKSMTKALEDSATTAIEPLRSLLLKAINLPSYQPLDAAQQFGLPCHIEQGLPLAWHLLTHSKEFESTVRDNILCGGDSCGRATAIGSVAGLFFGVPTELKSKVAAHLP